jgi:hypothetical protein
VTAGRAELHARLEVERHQPLPPPGPLPGCTPAMTFELAMLQGKSRREAAVVVIRTLDPMVVAAAHALMRAGRGVDLVAESCGVPVDVVHAIAQGLT